MRKRFNVSGTCFPEEHYMVNIDGRLKQIIAMIQQGEYFCINRARQFGKTTLLEGLFRTLKKTYTVFFLSFEGLDRSSYESSYDFNQNFCTLLLDSLDEDNQDSISEESINKLEKIADGTLRINFTGLNQLIRELCQSARRPVILLIDEVDNACNNQIFLDFLGTLRMKYLQRKRIATFQSVILTGVYDIKNLKLKIRPNEEHRYNSPWNIAAKFTVDMSFSTVEIKAMLLEYAADCNIEINAAEISQLIYDYTSGYPYLVSQICKLMDEVVSKNSEFPSLCSVWTQEGFLAAIKLLLKEQNTLFDDIIKKLSDHHKLKLLIQDILFVGNHYPYQADNETIQLGTMFGFLKDRDSSVAVANRIFEVRLYDYFLSEDMVGNAIYQAASANRNQFIVHGMLQMKLVMEKFFEYYTELYNPTDEAFVENQGRKLFLLFLKPIINGTGNYYIEAQTRDQKRTDIIVDYHGQQFIIELKLWHGKEYEERGKKQLFEYLNYYHKEQGYLLSFNFNKKKTIGIQELQYENKRILEVIV